MQTLPSWRHFAHVKLPLLKHVEELIIQSTILSCTLPMHAIVHGGHARITKENSVHTVVLLRLRQCIVLRFQRLLFGDHGEARFVGFVVCVWVSAKVSH